MEQVTLTFWSDNSRSESICGLIIRAPERDNLLNASLAEVAVPRQLFAAIVERIGRLRLLCVSGGRWW